jgi:hypothetical protein
MESPVRKLYHGTLARNIPSIRERGLLPQKGLWTESFHDSAVDLVYAVDEDRRARIVPAITGQIARHGLVQWSDDYEIEHFYNDLVTHGAVVVINAATFCYYPSNFLKKGHPAGSEPGDYYSRESVGVEAIERVMIEQEMLDWLKPIADADFTCRYREILREYCSF